MFHPQTLYTVTGGRETYYAAVDWESGRVWTSPTKDGARRQATEAGVTTLKEIAITRDAFLREMGVSDLKLRTPTEAAPHHVPLEYPRPKAQPTHAEAPWFIPGAGDAGPTGKLPSRSKFSGRGNVKAPKGKSPFTSRPIISPVSASGTDDNVVIVPAHGEAPVSPAAFSQTPPSPFVDGGEAQEG